MNLKKLSFSDMLDACDNNELSNTVIHTCKTTDQHLAEIAEEIEFDKNYFETQPLSNADFDFLNERDKQNELSSTDLNYQIKLDLERFFDVSFFDFSDIGSNFKVIWVIDPATGKLYIRDTVYNSLNCFNTDNGDGALFIDAMNCIIDETTPVIMEVALIGDKQVVMLGDKQIEINLYCNDINTKRCLFSKGEK